VGPKDIRPRTCRLEVFLERKEVGKMQDCTGAEISNFKSNKNSKIK
jgi:hypothetical protein